jgi:spore coat protein U domain-containing protein, fimbrial subunit CupE1/2/3/6
MNRIEFDPRITARFGKRTLGFALALWLGGGATLAGAVTCSVSTAGLAFGAYDVFAAGAVNGSATLTVACSFQSGVDTGNTPVAYTLSLSSGSSNSFVQRQMQSGTNALGYNLYTSNAYATVWGDGTGSTNTVSGSLQVNPGHPTASNQHTVYGQIPALQDVGVASDYKDNVTVTATY